MPMSHLTRLAGILVFALTAAAIDAADPVNEAAAVTALRGVASNIQKNRNGTVRFVRFSKAIVSDDHVAQTAAFANLDYLAVVTPSVGDAGLAHVGSLTNLDTLFLSDSGVTDAVLQSIGELPRLERLYLDRTAVTDEGLAALVNLQSLTTLTLDGTGITDAGLAHLTRLKNLEVLSLAQTAVTDDGLAQLATLSSLGSLNLDETYVTGAGLSITSQLANLEYLSLNRTTIQPAHLKKLTTSKSLRQLLLYDTALSTGNVTALSESSPHLQISLSPSADESRNALQRYLAGETLRSPVRSNEIDSPQRHVSDLHGETLPGIDVRLTASDETPHFQRHILPLLGRLGCNGRTCHGSFQGQGGFRLSMFGYDFDADHEALTGGEVPRVDLDAPDESLVIFKPTHADDHGGGQRFPPESWQHQLLRRWIEKGARGLPNGPQRLKKLEVTPAEIQLTQSGEQTRLRCIAVWADGTREDVTPLTRFQTNDEAVATVGRDGVITSVGPGDTYVVAYYDNAVTSTAVIRPVSDHTGDRFPNVDTPTEIDRIVVDKLARLGVVPSDVCDDAEFLRRVCLDVSGSLPSPDEVRVFLADNSPDKRSQKIDELLGSPAYAEWWSMKLADLTGSNSQYLGTTDMNTPAAQQWNAWLRRRVQENVGWDRIAAGMILAESRRPGQTYHDYAAAQSRHLAKRNPTEFAALDQPLHYYWFRSNNQQPTDRALSFGYVFLGVRLQCAQCHKHPFDQWSQEEFESFSQFFTRIKAGVAPSAKEQQLHLKTKLGVPVKLDTAALRRQMYLRVSAEGLPIPWNEIWIEPPGNAPQVAKLLGAEEIDLNDYADPREPLMAWLAREDNPYFAPAFVNRVWNHYFGVGIVEPPDDFNLANPPSNKPLLDWLSQEFIAHGYDMKWLHRTITNSRTYQTSWRTNDTNRADTRNFSHALMRRLPAEVTIDAILQATASDARNQTWRTDTSGRRITQHPKSIQARGIDYSLLVHGKPLRTTNCDCERQSQPTLLQSLFVRNDHEMLGWIDRKEGWLATVIDRASIVENSTAEAPDDLPDADEVTVHDDLIRTVYLRTVSREPTDAELARSRDHFAAAPTPPDGLRDLLWALLNTQEFLTNH